ncbi:MAG: transglycosylase SLT domain-containing protein, partial [Candidatus Adiutrix sp.]|nr:transglycosylase SLT domain-containing protein [Candidatus Adiutrix sp.]
MRRDFFRKSAPARRMGFRSGAWLLLLAGAAAACGGQTTTTSTIGRSAVSVAQESRAESGRHYTLGPQFADQLQDLLGREAEVLGGSREGVPLELNRQVLLNINRFLNEDRGFITRSLARGSKYIPMMKGIFRRKGLPEDLVYLALIESGFNNQAVSSAGAAGPWQFITSTGRRHGLVINDWVDERRDPVRSTYAAADYLIALHDAFGSWPMAIAAYNSGEGKIIRGVRNYGVSNFWDMSSAGDHLAYETKIYVPSFLAATFIAKDPAAYGLTIDDAQPPDQWEEVSLPQPVTLAEAAQFTHTSVARLRELNPHLKKAVTPPNEVNFILRLPEGSRQDFITAYRKSGLGQAQAAETLPPAPRAGATDLAHLRPELEAASSHVPLETPISRAAPPRPVTHTVVAGDTLGGLARKYHTSVGELLRLNKLKSDRLRLGQSLKVKEFPGLAPAAPMAAQASSAIAPASPAVAPASPAAAAAAPGGIYTVVPGGT